MTIIFLINMSFLLLSYDFIHKTKPFQIIYWSFSPTFDDIYNKEIAKRYTNYELKRPIQKKRYKEKDIDRKEDVSNLT